jgi:hypothetical protein
MVLSCYISVAGVLLGYKFITLFPVGAGSHLVIILEPCLPSQHPQTGLSVIRQAGKSAWGRS